jgi:mannose-6-phosphate isomerase-like protein (cupin superfamily)
MAQPPEKVQKVNLADKLAAFDEPWKPRIVAELNGQLVKVARAEGEYVWHRHQREDELFLIVSGRLRILFRDGEVELGPGELCVVPRGVEHKPVALGEVELVLFEPAATRNTGDVDHAYTIEAEDLERI